MTIPVRRPTGLRSPLWPRSTIPSRIRVPIPEIVGCFYLGLVPRRYQSGEVDYVGSISEVRGPAGADPCCNEAANVMLTRYKGQLKLKDWAFAIARRSTDAQGQSRSGAPPRDHSCMRCCERRDRVRIGLSRQSTRQEAESSSPKSRATPEGGSRRRRRIL